ncbi:MAG: ATP-binding cassette domain-containing protein [Methylococcaceae bacterium]
MEHNMLLEMNVKLRRGNFDLVTDLSIQDESMGLLSRSGAGKSTILGLLAGTLLPESGRIALDGKILFVVIKESGRLSNNGLSALCCSRIIWLPGKL